MNASGSAFTLTRTIDETNFDIAIIGGGITGICVAREAASRGLKTILFERDDFGSGTSSATTKYIHGGIRYLEVMGLDDPRSAVWRKKLTARLY